MVVEAAERVMADALVGSFPLFFAPGAVARLWVEVTIEDPIPESDGWRVLRGRRTMPPSFLMSSFAITSPRELSRKTEGTGRLLSRRVSMVVVVVVVVEDDDDLVEDEDEKDWSMLLRVKATRRWWASTTSSSDVWERRSDRPAVGEVGE